jgi:16S rRNA (cytosine967-C5)-methyltransferase
MTDSAESRTAGRRADPARLAAGRILDAVLERGAFANLAAVRLLERKSLQPIDRRFASAIVYGTLSRIVSIDWLLAAKSKTPLAALDPWVRTLLRMGVWQLRWARSVPAASAVDESVRLARLLAGPGGSAYVNAVLRQMAESPAILPANNPAVLYSLPPDLYGVLRKAYGDA